MRRKKQDDGNDVTFGTYGTRRVQYIKPGSTEPSEQHSKLTGEWEHTHGLAIQCA